MIALARLALCALIAWALGVQAGEQWLLTQRTAQISRTEQQIAQPREVAIAATNLAMNEMNPSRHLAAFARAQVAIRMGEHGHALEWLARCEGRVVNQTRWLRTQAFALYHLGRHAEALAALEKAFAIDPTLPDQEVRMLEVLRERAPDQSI